MRTLILLTLMLTATLSEAATTFTVAEAEVTENLMVHWRNTRRRNLPMTLYWHSISYNHRDDSVRIQFSARDTKDPSLGPKTDIEMTARLRATPVMDFYLEDIQLAANGRFVMSALWSSVAVEALERQLKRQFAASDDQIASFHLEQTVVRDGELSQFKITFENWQGKTDEIRLQQFEKILHDNRYTETPASVLQHILSIEKSSGRILDIPEIIKTAVDFADAHGLDLVRKRCFTCGMEVLTPEGYRRIDALTIGEEVMSWDFDTHTLVRNKITAIHSSDNVAYGELTDHSRPGKPFEVTPDHPFALPTVGGSSPIGQIAESQFLLGLRGDKPATCEARLTARGPFQPRGVGPVRTLTLEHAPNNFIVNGLVALNKPIHLT